MINSKNFILLMLLFLGISLTSTAQNKSTVLKELSKRADVIVTGKVTENKSSWNDSKTRIYTRTTLQVDEVFKGNNNENTIEITYPGGEVGDVGELYTHMPTFKNDEEVLVFLKKDTKDNRYKVLNGEEGKITIINDKKTNEKVTTSNVKINSLKAQIKNYVND